MEGISFLDGYDVVSCETCGFVYAANIPEQAEFDAYYINANKYEHEIEQPDVITGKYEHIIKDITHLNIDKTASIVDIGCARSEVLRSLRNMGFSDLTGVDPSVKNIEYLKSKGINGIHATINTVDTEKQYDVVFFLAVLEHIVDLHQTLDTLHAVTAMNGIIVVSVPDMDAPASGELPYQEFSREHINYFTEVSLSNLMTRYGFYKIFSEKQRGDIIGFFRKQSTAIQNDDIGVQKIQNYINWSKSYEDTIYIRLREYSDTPIIVWGLGTFTQRLLVKNVLRNIIALVDSNPQYAGKKYRNIDIIPPVELKKYKEPVLLAVSPRYIDAIIHTVKYEMKLENEIIKLHTDYAFEYSMGRGT
jgi:2-polyprenyl-3-methyl-5-hydroxy-6-metoxy-1,4-benzoquinol methylase